MNSDFFKKVLSVFLASVLFVTAFSFALKPSNLIHAATLSDLQSYAEAIKERISSNKSKLESIKSDLSKQQEYLETLKENIAYTENQIDNLTSQIGIIETQITEVENSIASLQKEIDQINEDIETTDKKIKSAENSLKKTYDQLRNRLRSSFISGEDSNLKLLLSADSISTFLRRLEFMKRISEDDKKAINDFKAQAEVLELSRSSLEERTQLLEKKQTEIKDQNAYLYTKKTELESKKADQSSVKKELENQYAEVQSTINNLDKNSAYYQSLIANQKAEQERAEAEIDAYIAALTTTTTMPPTTTTTETTTVIYSDAESTSIATEAPTQPQTVQPVVQPSVSWLFPVPKAGRYISSGFGYRSASISGWAFHGGIDITGNIYGEPIYATRAGTVIKADNVSNTGYGHYIILDHGDGFVSVYGHCAQVIVVSGQTVTQGQVIGYVGSTGNSTGPHLHFEIRYNGEKQNPLNYVSL